LLQQNQYNNYNSQRKTTVEYIWITAQLMKLKFHMLPVVSNIWLMLLSKPRLYTQPATKLTKFFRLWPKLYFITHKKKAITHRKIPIWNSIASGLPFLLCWPLLTSVIKKKDGLRFDPTTENALYVIRYRLCDT
jgi:hypothetical protein